ncbi:TRAP transporter small permease subunit [Kiloniella sp. b19]|uniref:TRAP transporter small permease subunit n=1 Tax=Kiloniella sp. GXU_MW_B19 TaxID=3141326 RepID=UPI0031E34B30
MQALVSLASAVDALNNRIGRIVSWLALIMVVVQFAVVLMRYAFGVNSIFLQESIVYMHASLFMLGAGYTLLHGGHVRVDIFYRTAPEHKKALVDLLGSLFLLLPVCILITAYSWGFVEQSWSIRESSVETSGIPLVYVLKTLILLFCGVLILQGVAMALHSLATLMGRDHLPEEEGLAGFNDLQDIQKQDKNKED